MTLNINEVISERYAWATQNRQTERLHALMRTGGCHVYAAGRYGRQVARRCAMEVTGQVIAWARH
jgi:hypothetical protein